RVKQVARVVEMDRRVRKVLSKIGEAGIQRIASHADDPGVWQRVSNETGVQEIVRHLVDKARVVCRGRTRARQVTCTELPPVDGADTSRHVPIQQEWFL